LLTPFVVWKNILIEDKLKDLGSLLFILKRTFKYNIFLIAAMLQIVIFLLLLLYFYNRYFNFNIKSKNCKSNIDIFFKFSFTYCFIVLLSF